MGIAILINLILHKNRKNMKAFILLFGFSIANECYDCYYEGNDPENNCLTAKDLSELKRCDSGQGESNRGCRKQLDERTIAGETIYTIQRLCAPADNICTENWASCGPVYDGQEKIGQNCGSCCTGNLCNDGVKYHLSPVLIICILILSFLN